MGKEIGGKKLEDSHSFKCNEMARCNFQPQQPLVCDTFKDCEGLSRVAFMDGNRVVMLGKSRALRAQGGDDKVARRSDAFLKGNASRLSLSFRMCTAP